MAYGLQSDPVGFVRCRTAQAGQRHGFDAAQSEAAFHMRSSHINESPRLLLIDADRMLGMFVEVECAREVEFVFELVKELTELPGPTGHEDAVQDWVERRWSEFAVRRSPHPSEQHPRPRRRYRTSAPPGGSRRRNLSHGEECYRRGLFAPLAVLQRSAGDGRRAGSRRSINRRSSLVGRRGSRCFRDGERSRGRRGGTARRNSLNGTTGLSTSAPGRVLR